MTDITPAAVLNTVDLIASDPLPNATPRDAITAAIARTSRIVAIIGRDMFVACLSSVATAANVSLGEALAVLRGHAEAPLFCGDGVVATYNADDATVIVHRRPLH